MAAPASVTSRLMYFPLPRLLNRLHQLSFPRTFHCTLALFIPSPPPVSTSTLIPDFCLHPRFVHAFSCRRSAPTAPTLSTPFPRSFRETVQLSSRFEPLFFAVSFREKAEQGEKGAGKEGRKEGGIEKVGLDWVLLKGGNALFKCSPREHTEDKTAPRRRIRRVNRHTTLPSLFFPSFYQLLLQGGGARQFSRCNTRSRRGTGSTKLFNLFLHQLHTRKEMIFHLRWIDPGIPIRESLEWTISSLTFVTCCSYLRSATNRVFESSCQGVKEVETRD